MTLTSRLYQSLPDVAFVVGAVGLIPFQTRPREKNVDKVCMYTYSINRPSSEYSGPHLLGAHRKKQSSDMTDLKWMLRLQTHKCHGVQGQGNAFLNIS